MDAPADQPPDGTFEGVRVLAGPPAADPPRPRPPAPGPPPAPVAPPGAEPGAGPGGELTTPGAPSRWPFTDVMAGLGVVLLVSLLISVAVNLARPTSPWATLLLGLLPIWIGLLGTALWASRTRGTGRLSVDLGFRFRWVDLAIGLGVGLGLRVVAYLFAVVAASLTGDRPAGNVPQPGTAGLAYAIVLALCLTVGAPLIEELFFRGLAVRATLSSLEARDQRRGRPPRDRRTLTAVVTGLLFACLHLNEVGSLATLVALFPSLFAAGWVFAQVAMHTGRIGPAIVSHAVFNGVPAIALVVAAAG